MISNLLYIPAMISISFVTKNGIASVAIWGIFTAVSTTIYYLSYMIDFSKVRSVEHSGKEIAFMNIFEKIAICVSPVIGGLIALFFGPRILMLVSALLFLIAALPLMNTSEPVRVDQKVNFKHFPWRIALRSLIAETATGFDYITTGVVWGLFVAIVALSGAGDAVYVGIGALSSISIVAAITASYAFGKIIDKNKGGCLLKIGVVTNAIVHAFRSFSVTPISILGINITNEMATTGYNLAFMRGIFDTADLSGHRIVYLCATGVASTLGAIIGCIIAAACIILFGDINGIKIFFFIAAVAVLAIGSANFNVYRK